ncbi:MAG: hypothetical protein KAJ18_06375 [Candidatus Omnitrophica bacterium]|nr:hypothetical protein [Candidatus Omnitrophota bacterium]
MFLRIYKKGSSVVEFMALIVFLLSMAFVFQHYIVRGLSGQWRKVGDTFGHGKQYDPRNFDVDDGGSGEGTLTCIFAEVVDRWVMEDCYEDTCDCTLPEEDPQYDARCPSCLMENCQSSYCVL